MMSDICPYCQLDTAGNHEFNCPNYGPSYVIMGGSNQENYILQKKLERDKALKERDELAARVEELEELLSRALPWIINPISYTGDRDKLEYDVKQALGGDDSRS